MSENELYVAPLHEDSEEETVTFDILFNVSGVSFPYGVNVTVSKNILTLGDDDRQRAYNMIVDNVMTNNSVFDGMTREGNAWRESE